MNLCLIDVCKKFWSTIHARNACTQQCMISQSDFQSLEEDADNLEEWWTWTLTEDFDFDDLICGVDIDCVVETQVDNDEVVPVNDSSSASNNHNPREGALVVPQPESNCQAQEDGKRSCENPDSKRHLRKMGLVIRV